MLQYSSGLLIIRHAKLADNLPQWWWWKISYHTVKISPTALKLAGLLLLPLSHSMQMSSTIKLSNDRVIQDFKAKKEIMMFDCHFHCYQVHDDNIGTCRKVREPGDEIPPNRTSNLHFRNTELNAKVEQFTCKNTIVDLCVHKAMQDFQIVHSCRRTVSK